MAGTMFSDLSLLETTPIDTPLGARGEGGYFGTSSRVKKSQPVSEQYKDWLDQTKTQLKLLRLNLEDLLDDELKAERNVGKVKRRIDRIRRMEEKYITSAVKAVEKEKRKEMAATTKQKEEKRKEREKEKEKERERKKKDAHAERKAKAASSSRTYTIPIPMPPPPPPPPRSASPPAPVPTFAPPIKAEVSSDTYRLYDDRWYRLQSASPDSAFLFTFATIPWPVVIHPKDPTIITPQNIAAFLLSHKNIRREHKREVDREKDRVKKGGLAEWTPLKEGYEKTRRGIIRGAMLRWHPDKWNDKLLAWVEESEREKVIEGVGMVMRGLNEIMRNEKGKST